MQIHLGPSEFVTEVRGTMGPYSNPSNKCITSLRFVTNIASYGPFGKGEGTPFHIPEQSNNSSIVGFFGRGGWYVDAIGAYINHDTENPKQKEKVLLASVGLHHLLSLFVTYFLFDCAALRLRRF